MYKAKAQKRKTVYPTRLKTPLAKRFEAYGYELYANVTDVFGKRYRFGRRGSPGGHGGVHLNFSTVVEAENNLVAIARMRAMLEDIDAELKAKGCICGEIYLNPDCPIHWPKNT